MHLMGSICSKQSIIHFEISEVKMVLSTVNTLRVSSWPMSMNLRAGRLAGQ